VHGLPLYVDPTACAESFSSFRFPCLRLRVGAHVQYVSSGGSTAFSPLQTRLFKVGTKASTIPVGETGRCNSINNNKHTHQPTSWA
jgi:hypothetical protein